MSSLTLLTFIIGYFAVMILISYLTSRKSTDNDTFFIANRNSKWYLVAFGMIGTSLSGITFISVPGTVNTDAFSYFQFVLGNVIGYVIIALVLMPLYYKMKLTSIYTYLEHRFGFWSYKTGAFFFLISRLIGAAFRLFLVAIVFQHFIFDQWGVPFWVTVAISILLIWTYTFRGGLKTIIITDTIQTIFLIAAVVLSIIFIAKILHLDFGTLFTAIKDNAHSKIFVWDHFIDGKRHFIKYFLGGIGVSVATTGLDQDLMQKNLSCRNLFEAKKNMFSFTGVFVFVNLLFLSVGTLLIIFSHANHIPIPDNTDYIFPNIALFHLGFLPAIIFILGLTAATFSTADSALTALTTSFCVDFLGLDKKQVKKTASKKAVHTRKGVHVLFSILLFIAVIIFKYLVDEAVVKAIFMAASFTYGPLLGMFMFGILHKQKIRDQWVPFVCILSPFICWILDSNSAALFGGYQFSFELLIVNGFLTYIGLWFLTTKKKSENLKL